MAAQPQHRQADDDRDHRGHRDGRRQGEPRREADGRRPRRGQHRGGVAADGEEARVAQRYLAGVAHEEAQAEGHQGVVGGHRELGEQELHPERREDELGRDHGRGKREGTGA